MQFSPKINRASKKLLIPFDRIKGLWPNATTIDYHGTKIAILPHDTRTQIRLRAAEIEAPAPILYYYDWRSSDGVKPFEVQRQTAALATSNQRAYILNDLGTGKTRASLWAWRYLYDAGVAHRLLVVAPLSTLKFVWAREIALTMPELKVAVLHGSREQRLAGLKSDSQVYIINHDGLKIIVAELHERHDIDTMILDELTVYRNNSQRSKQMREFARRFAWVWGLTGRPMPHSPVDVWAQCKILTPARVPKVRVHAQTMLMQQVDAYRWVPRAGAIETAFEWMQPSVRYSLDDVVELPEAIYRTVDVELSDEQTDVYQRLATHFMALVQEQKITVANAGVALGKLLQVSAGYVYSDNPRYVALDSTPRQETLLELVSEAPHKVIVFAPWRHLIENLSTLLTKEEIDHAVVHGEISNREKIFNAFQNTPQYQVLLAHPGCVHHGLTLTAASTIIWYSPVTSLDIYEQASARIRRVGQKNKQLYLHMQATAVERRVYGILRTNKSLQDAFLQLIKTATADGEDNAADERENGNGRAG